ncbi:universal stress protein [Hippea sp. KM1]|uniref:universal stress protein n=1 Tax=Hippea sp. KM1 TaxID=944481 RepID=UPI00046D45F4|nr:universal stress protein [Hippea sp. KM1]
MAKYGLVVVAKGSEKGVEAARSAARIARKNNKDKVHLLFINDTDFYSGEGLGFVKDDLRKSMENIGDAIMRKLEHEIKKEYPEVEVERIELEGKTAEELMRFLKEHDIEVLIIPKEERGPIERSLTGGDIEPFFNEIQQRVKCILIE